VDEGRKRTKQNPGNLGCSCRHALRPSAPAAKTPRESQGPLEHHGPPPSLQRTKGRASDKAVGSACAVGADATQHESSSLCSLAPLVRSTPPCPMRSEHCRSGFTPRRTRRPKTRLPGLSPFERSQVIDDVVHFLGIKFEYRLAWMPRREPFSKRFRQELDRIAVMHLAQRRCIWHRAGIGSPDRMAT
jgi:hypothetical protein